MTTVYEIPTSPEAQYFRCSLSGRDYYLRLVWNSVSLCWVLDIYDEDEVPLIQGIPVVTGVDLLGQYEHVGIGGALIAQTDHDPDVVPSLANLGTTGHLYYVVEP